MHVKISDEVKYIGVDDTSLDLFESQYVIPDGVSYNSYVLLDEKVAVIDTVDERGMKEWEENLMAALDGKKVDYLVIQHLEPDHAGGIFRMRELFPEITLVGNPKTFLFLSQFMKESEEWEKLVVKEKERLSLGKHTLTFFMATMVHWPEVMVTYDEAEKILFSADAFGKFGALEATEEDDWACEARRYYFNIVGKYGVAVQALLQKVTALEVQKICPAHGPILEAPLEEYVQLYDTWSRYEPETKGVLIAYGSFHGNTAKAAKLLAKFLEEEGEKEVVLRDLAREDMAEVIEDAFRYDRMILAAVSHDAGVFPQMKDFLHRLQSKGYQNRKVAIVENGTWSPSAGRVMRELLETMKNVEIVEPMVTIRSTCKDEEREMLKQMAAGIAVSSK